MARIRVRHLKANEAPPAQVKRTVKLITTQHITSDPPEVEEIPMRQWSIEIYLVGPDGDTLPATCFEKATYVLHDSFGPKRAKQMFRQPPFRIVEKGWGEFDMQILLAPTGSKQGQEIVVAHDLNFQQGERYESVHSVTFKNPKEPLLSQLRESGPPGEANGTASGKPEKSRRQKSNKNVDMEKLAEALPQLAEDDLLQVVQMVHDNKTEDTYTKNDVENGEFHVDLYTLPDPLIKMLWDFCDKKVDINAL
ncbi:SAS complex, SAS5 subunit/transcription initiation factor IID, subunit 14 [Teratosphaeria nubilosa]|uniref:SAS complex, SAS5 subunit/transcription initiation factor IID, subunit 14 n=1 Tax=Teratosphaeria nubilosa TaxID=161662 RepID=A0A6G1KUG4_9PEZI|nr:SAS complex, SAS5 subunit/transcription initiation factor IID, subunit 14 [Teratosphaeria nubilosa]